jgi:2C-methyl-D-erythritol 2,4-cyclodiphosphate synthase
MTIVKPSESRNKLTQNMYRIQNAIASNTKVDKTTNNVTIASRTQKRLTISGTKTNIEVHGSLNSVVISKRSPIKKLVNVFLLREI